MSELIQKSDNRATIRWKLLTGASALVLTAYVSSTSVANAGDSTRPQIWIEFGGQLSRLQDGQEIYAPPFVALTPPPFSAPQKAERPPLYGLDENASLTFQPEGSSWVFSASIRYGRTSSGKHVRHQSYSGQFTAYSRFHRTTGTSTFQHTNFRKVDPIAGRFTDAVVKQSENHAILDFQAGKDLGLGLFGADTSSTLSVGVRIAQFRSKSRINLKEDPDWQFKPEITGFSTFYYTYYYGEPFSFGRTNEVVNQPHRTFVGKFQAKRSFGGVGPSVSWSSSVPFAGNSQDGGLSVDWGLNAALLFGRQKVKASHQTTAQYDPGIQGYAQHISTTYKHGPYSVNRSRNVTVPNVGGFAGISWNYDNAKVSFGYRADFFFNAIDGGIDTAKKEDRGFYGPYASISIDLGD